MVYHLFYVLVLLLHGMWDLSSTTRDGTPILFIERLSFNHWTTGTFPVLFLLFLFFVFFFCHCSFIMKISSGASRCPDQLNQSVCV